MSSISLLNSIDAPSYPMEGKPLGSVPYLNAKPLCYGLEETLVYAPPVELAQKLRSGALEGALVPVMECLEHPHYDVVDGAGICCRGPVASVLLETTKPLAALQTVALDPASKTSNQLTRVLLEHFHGLKPRYVSQEEAAGADARLVIGDAALALRQGALKGELLDLGELWWNATGLPFIFAVWALQPHPENLARARQLRGVQQAGLTARSEIAADAYQQAYLFEKIRYEIGYQEKQGLEKFCECLVKLGVLGSVPELKWI